MKLAQHPNENQGKIRIVLLCQYSFRFHASLSARFISGWKRHKPDVLEFIEDTKKHGCQLPPPRVFPDNGLQQIVNRV